MHSRCAVKYLVVAIIVYKDGRIIFCGTFEVSTVGSEVAPFNLSISDWFNTDDAKSVRGSSAVA